MSSLMLRLSLLVGLVIALAAGAPAVAQNLLGMGRPFEENNALLVIDRTNATVIGGVAVRLAGRVVIGCSGLATHPVTGQLWGLLNERDNANRLLAKIDPVTGNATLIGDTSGGNRSFSGIAFNADGSKLYAIAGQDGNDSRILFTLNQSNGAATLLCDPVDGGSQGETIAFDSTDGKLYYGSGTSPKVFETIDDTSTCSTTNIPLTGSGFSRFHGLTFLSSENRFYLTDSSNLYTLTPTGTATFVGSVPEPFDFSYKGLAFNAAAPLPPPCPPLATLYVSTTDGNSVESTLWAVDAANGAARYVGRIGFERVGAMDFGPDEKLYGVGERLGTGTQVLITINPCTGAGTEIGPVTGLSGFTTDISFRNADNALVGYNTNHQVYTINTTTGAATVLGNSGNNGSGNGIAFSPTDTLFHSDESDLHSLNQTTGAGTIINPMIFPIGPSFRRAPCMDFRPGTSDLYAVINEEEDDWYLGRINTATAVVTSLGQTISRADGMAFSPYGSCCAADGSCSVTTDLNCATTWTQGGTCSPNPCPQPPPPPPTGACCHADGACSDTVTQADCSDDDEEWHEGETCDTDPCINEATEIDPDVSVETVGGVTATGSVSKELPANPPAGATFPNGVVTLKLTKLAVGGATTAKLKFVLPAGQTINTYYKFGVESGNTTPHWYQFDFNGTTGAEINGNVVTLHFVDGQRGDNDLTANGAIDDPGGPASQTINPTCFNPLLSFLFRFPICGIGCLVSLFGTFAGLVAMKMTALRHHRRRQ